MIGLVDKAMLIGGDNGIANGVQRNMCQFAFLGQLALGEPDLARDVIGNQPGRDQRDGE